MKGIVFGLTYERAESEFQLVRRNYALQKIPIVKEIKQKHLHQIYYDNGDQWTCRAITDSCRGHRAHVVYIDRAIEDYDMLGIIHNCNTALPWSAYRYFG